VRWLADVAGGLFGVDRRAAGEDDVIEHGQGEWLQAAFA
jgi:hypothetical protein